MKISRKNKKIIHIFEVPKKIYFLIALCLIIGFLLYGLWYPPSQVFIDATYNNNPELMLTFDDGPGENTQEILNILNSQNKTAAFFITCDHIDKSEISLIKKISDDGHIVALHGKNHLFFQKRESLSSCKEQLENITGQKVKYFRPPYGFRSPGAIIGAKKMNLTLVTWSVFPRDYSANSHEQISNRVENNFKSDSIICLHDGPAERDNTVRALPEILRIIDEKEYKEKLQITELK
jgi:peptidoglycan-N-acetylglucosamine deacetylase